MINGNRYDFDMKKHYENYERENKKAWKVFWFRIIVVVTLAALISIGAIYS